MMLGLHGVLKTLTVKFVVRENCSACIVTVTFVVREDCRHLLNTSVSFPNPRVNLKQVSLLTHT